MGTTLTPKGPVDPESLKAIEVVLGTRLPETYRTWILHTGGGVLARRIVIPGTEGNGLLTTIGAPSDLALLGALETHHLVPTDYLVIAQGHGGSLAVRTALDDHGSIWWADFDKADDLEIEAPSNEIMLRLADHFDAFLASVGIDM